jgi:YD repeat-containing protein
MRILLLSLALLAQSALSTGQIIDNAHGISLVEENRFNEQFIRNNKIAVIRGEYSSKKEKDIIRNSNEKVEYMFDRAGRLYQINYIRILTGNKKDITSTVYRYNTDGTLIDKIMADLSGATSYRYEYNEQKQIISETCSRMESPRDTLSEIGPKRTEVYTESIKHFKLDNGHKKVTYNNYNTPYKEEFTYFDDNGYLTSYRTRFITNNRQSKTEYAYNERGLLSEKIFIADLARQDTVRLTYEYDNAGNLLTAIEYKGSEAIRRIEFLYDSKTWLLTARLARDEENTFIRIAQYKTEFFE